MPLRSTMVPTVPPARLAAARAAPKLSGVMTATSTLATLPSRITGSVTAIAARFESGS